MKETLKALIFVIAALSFTGGACPSRETTSSNRVAQSEIYQNYSVVQSGDHYEVTAWFRVGGKTGTTLALVSPSIVKFNGRSMNENLNTATGTFYSLTEPLETTAGVFEFTDRDNKTYTNRIDLRRAALHGSVPRSNGSAPVAIALKPEVPSTATVCLELNDLMVSVDAAPADQSEAYHDREKNTVVILPAAWSKVESGKVAVDVEIYDAISTQQGTRLGGEISFRYNPAPVTIAYAKSSKGKTSARRSAKTSRR